MFRSTSLDDSARLKPSRSTYGWSLWWFHRALGLVYLAAFWSLATQIVGLVGRSGIAPAGVSDEALRGVCVAGAVVAALAAAGIAPLATLTASWAAYLWLSTITGPFLSYQWDALLLETGFLAIFLAPFVVRDRLRDASDPPRLAVWLMLWLLFRLMFGSGAVKLASGDPTWRNLTALTFHYETQPIPTPVAWYAHHLPVWFHKATTAATLAIELIAPFVIVGPRRLRMAAFVLLVGLQATIALTGNYAFFNFLAAALCLFLLDDATWLRAAKAFRPSGSAALQGCPPAVGRPEGLRYPWPAARRAIVVAVAVVTVPVSLLMFTGSLGVDMPGWPLVVPIARAIEPLRSVNSYGLFAVMTTTRPEIVLEGSNDGETWLEYEFKSKAGDVHRRPPWVAPHQPRLDWQMWFAALSRSEDEPWYQNLYLRLLQGSPAVLQLLDRDPFHGRPPRYVRGALYEYHFSDGGDAWWRRQRLGAYSPAMSLTPARNSP